MDLRDQPPSIFLCFYQSKIHVPIKLGPTRHPGVCNPHTCKPVATAPTPRARCSSPKRQYRSFQPGKLIQPQILKRREKERHVHQADEGEQLIPATIPLSFPNEAVNPPRSSPVDDFKAFQHIKRMAEALDITVEEVQEKPHKLLDILHSPFLAW